MPRSPTEGLTPHHPWCTVVGVFDPWIPLAAARRKAWLKDGTEVTLVGIPKAAGQRARVEYPNGYRRTVALADIATIEQPLPLEGTHDGG